nr:hypothetical protein [Tanacetum cinerariifolium]
LFDSIKSSRVQSKEHCDDLINKVNLKSVEVSDLDVSLQEKVLVITALKEQVDVALLVPKLHKNRTAHTDYIRHTQEEADTLREIVESERLLSPLNTSLAYACKYTRQIQELLMILQQTCPSIIDLGTQLVEVTPKNKTKQIRPYINSVNARKKSKSVKTPVKKKVWKSTGKVFKTVGYIWKPTGRTFTLVGNVCPLTRIATATIVPPREPILIVKSTDKLVVTLVYNRKPKAKNVPNKMEPNNSWGSSSNVSSSHTDCRLSKSSFGIWTSVVQST